MKVYQYNKEGYYIAETKAYNGLMPHNTTDIMPTFEDGYIPQFNGKKWLQIENHIGIKGYLNGDEYEIKDYGALPENFSFEKPLPSLEEAKEQKISELKIAKENVEQDFIIYKENKYDCDQTSIVRISLAKESYIEPILWKDYNNLSQELNFEDLKALLSTIYAHISDVHKKYNAYKERIENITNVEEILAINWE